ncbi:MAG: HAD family hydrolase [Spirochaetales bacterium]|nr:HAD family hydrolase [Spirochaetales bacterium]
MNQSLKKFLEPGQVIQPVPTDQESCGMKLPGIKAFIFDIYGTLLISVSGDVGSAVQSGSSGAFRHALTAAGLENCSEDLYEKIRDLFFGYIKETHSRLRTEGYPHPEVDIVKVWTDILVNSDLSSIYPNITAIHPEIAAAAYESTVNPVYPMPGMFELLSHPLLQNAELGIISNAQFYTPLIFDYLTDGGLAGLGFNPELCIYSYTERRAKPDLILFETHAERLASCGIHPSEAVFIGNDMLNDIMPAAMAGYRTILFAGDKRSLRLRLDHDACKDIKPDVIVNNLIDIPDYIQEG